MRGAKHTLAHRGKALRGGLALAASMAKRGFAPFLGRWETFGWVHTATGSGGPRYMYGPV